VSRILIAEDEARLSSFLEKGLRAAGHVTTVCRNGGLAAVLAGQDGFDVLRTVRGRGERIPVLVLTARQRVEDTVAALEEGADDYLTKPFVFDELMARVRARVRSAGGQPEQTVLEASDLTLDLRTREARVGETAVALTAREFTLLETLLRHRGQVLSRDELLSHVWGHGAGAASNIVEVYMSSLRRKLGAERFETVRGHGYRMPPEPPADA
jgi:two-component system copper resistance phosphate regulon response regulator CusR